MSNHLFSLWRTAWKKHIEQLGASKWNKKKWREPFELLGAALSCSFNALKCMPESVLHSKVRTAIKDRQDVWKSLSSEKPDFCLLTEDKFKVLFATMHLASSSFRLSTALFLIYREISNQKKASLSELLKENRSDWDRNKKLKNPLKNTKDLKCCLQGKLPDEKVALAMIMAHRDEFGHGEKGRGGGWWVQHREEYFNEFFICQILQAQLVLTELASDELSRIK